MATAGDAPLQFDSSPGELSSPTSTLSKLASPSQHPTRRPDAQNRQPKPAMEEIVVSSEQNQQGQQSQQSFQQYQGPSPPSNTSAGGREKRYSLFNGEWVQLTAAGVPRKKPGRKPGSVVKPKAPSAAASNAGDVSDQAKPRRPKKTRETSTPPIQRKRKLAPASEAENEVSSPRALAPAAVSSPSPSMQQSYVADAMSRHHSQQHSGIEQRNSPKMPKRDGYPSSMHSILNTDEPTPTQSPNHNQSSSSTSIPVRTSGQSYDPIRGNYDPVRETITPHNHYSANSGSPRGPAPAQPSHRSPSIASMIEPQMPAKASPQQQAVHAYQPTPSQSRLQAHESSVPTSPSFTPKAATTANTPVLKPSIVQEARRETLAPTPPPPRPIINQANVTTIANGPVKKISPKQKPAIGVSTPKTDNLDDAPQEQDERSILDFGKARPGEEKETPTIVLTIPIHAGETNRYVNFMRLAEDQYGWDALHPRLAANRDRKARIAAAAASLEKIESGRESGDEMSVDLSDGEGSNPDNGGTSGPDAQAKPKKKRNFKEDQYDVDDDFVDDSEMLWEAQAAASRDGFFVYSGPLIPEAEAPAAGQEGPPKRGRGGRGSRGGGRGGAARGGAGTGRGGGPGSRGGAITRKPRITKSEKAQREKEKAERETLAQLAKSGGGLGLQPTTPSFTVRELGA